ncbi:MAG: uracil-DNA glycosylase [Peptococcaceae bacterium]|nr:uracil-DNA glycosylase [Peptococcaceae bacterium]
MVHFLQNDWAEVLDDEFAKPYYKELREFLKQAYRTERVFPPMEDIYNALRVTSYADTKVVILGQDPYHGPGQAHGLSFSVRPGVQPPPSLINIFKEMEADVGCARPNHGCLLGWAEQGVLLLNTTLTVAQGRPKSHAGHGWETLTDAIIQRLSERQTPLVFILWGAHAQSKMPLIDTSRHHIIKSPHPSPLSASRGFFGSRPFSRANAYLIQDGLEPIDWCKL